MVNDSALTWIKNRPLEIIDTLDIARLMHVDQQNRDPGVAKDANIEDIENLMLFEVDSDLKEIDGPIKETSSERRFQMRDLSKITPIKESQYKASKF